jgi:mono/diheme cytochrome c family protein
MMLLTFWACAEPGTAILSGDPAEGAAIYAEHGCVGCHGPEGSGASAPSLIEHVPCHTDDELRMVLRGERPEMPDQNLDTQQTLDVLAWLRQQYGDFRGEEDPICAEFRQGL